MQRGSGIQPRFLERKCLHDVEHFQSGQTLAIWRQFVNGPAAIGGRNRVHPFCGIFGKIFFRMRSAMPARGLYNAFGKLALVEGVAAALSDQAKRASQVWIAEDLSDGWGAVVRKIRPGGSLISPQEIGIRTPKSGSPL